MRTNFFVSTLYWEFERFLWEILVNYVLLLRLIRVSSHHLTISCVWFMFFFLWWSSYIAYYGKLLGTFAVTLIIWWCLSQRLGRMWCQWGWRWCLRVKRPKSPNRDENWLICWKLLLCKFRISWPLVSPRTLWAPWCRAWINFWNLLHGLELFDTSILATELFVVSFIEGEILDFSYKDEDFNKDMNKEWEKLGLRIISFGKPKLSISAFN